MYDWDAAIFNAVRNMEYYEDIENHDMAAYYAKMCDRYFADERTEDLYVKMTEEEL